MMKINLYLFLIICEGCLSLNISNDTPYCFQYTWVASGTVDTEQEYNCTAHKNVPCFEPVILSEQPPNTTKIWENKETFKLCPITSGNSCIKYTFTYNNELVNTSAFCGKVVEDQSTPITSGCYQQRKDGYVIEVCTCRSKRRNEPCNMSLQTKYSITLIITMLLFAFMKFAY